MDGISPSVKPPSRNRKRLKRTLLILTFVAVCIAIPVYVTAPGLPVADLEQIDPAIARTIRTRGWLVKFLPRSGSAWGKLATAYYMHHFNAQADEAFSHAERFSPSDPRWPYLRGLSMAEENLDAALPMLRRGANLAGDGPAAPRLRFAELAIELGLLEEAETHLSHVLQRDPKDARALLNMGRLELARGRAAESRGYLDRSVQQAPNVKAAHMLLATVLQQLGEKNSSEKHSRIAGSLPEKAFWPDPYRQEALALWSGEEALLGGAENAILQRDYKQARDLYRRAAKDYPAESRGWIGLGRAERLLGNRQEAKSSLQHALTLAPDLVQTRVELGGVFYEEKQFEEAAAHFREAIRLKPDLAEAWHNLGLTLTARGNPREAIDAFEKALTLKPDFADSHTFLGQAFAMTGQLYSAANQLDRALKISPDDVNAQTLRAQVRKAMEFPHR